MSNKITRGFHRMVHFLVGPKHQWQYESCFPINGVWKRRCSSCDYHQKAIVTIPFTKKIEWMGIGEP